MKALGITDPGKVRKQNQDFFTVERLPDGSVLALVCDGMGGAKAGNVASSLAGDVFKNEVLENYDARLTEDELTVILQDAVVLANQAVYEHSTLSTEFSGMGTTLVAALAREKTAVFINVGDSRAYYLSSDNIHPVTIDHSVVEMMVRRGEITREQAKTHPVKNLITRAIGTERIVEGDTFKRYLSKGDSILLCSDGLSNLLADQEILFEVKYGGEQENCCRRLLDLALERGAPDNVTAVLITV